MSEYLVTSLNRQESRVKLFCLSIKPLQIFVLVETVSSDLNESGGKSGKCISVLSKLTA